MTQNPRHLDWYQSSLCATNACVEVAADLDAVHVRDAENPEGPHLTIGPGAWRSFLRTIKSGRYDMSARPVDNPR